MEAASSSTQQPSRAKAFWRMRRRRRMDNLPQTMAISAGLFVCLAFAQTQMGVFDSWRKETDESASYSSSSSFFGPAHGRGLLSIGTDPVMADLPDGFCPVLATFNASTFSCGGDGNLTSTFPPLSFESSKGGATVFMVIITLYMFLGLAIVCDSFFEASLSAICEAQNLKDDVAGATWMAAGGSAPELATSIIGVFISKSDVGFGTIVGSAVFNVLFVIACCAFVAPNLKLTWWPLARDAAYYCFALAMIVIFVSDDMQIAVWEAVILLLMYGGYVTVMYFNERLEAWVQSRIEANEKPGNGLQQVLKKIIENPVFALLLYGVIVANSVMVILEMMEFNKRADNLPCLCGISVCAASLPTTMFGTLNLIFNIFFIVEMVVKLYAYGFFGYWRVPLNCFDGSLVFLIVVELILTSAAASDGTSISADTSDTFGVGVARLLRLLKFVRFIRTLRVLRLARGFKSSSVQPESGTEGELELGAKEAKTGEPAKEGEGTEEEEDDDDDDDGPFNPFEMWGDMSSAGGLFGRTMWFIGLPLSIAFWLTIPDCRREMFSKGWWYLGTFSMCIAWIAILSAFMVWMVERLGVMYEVPTSIMGIFVLAAGTSIPDCLSSIAVARRGHGDMAVSSSIGSNIFDVLIGLPIPWFLYTGVLRPAIGESFGPQWVPVQSAGLAVMILLLFVMVALVITVIHLSGWLLSIRLGLAMMGLYFVFLVFALLLERQVMFPPCQVIDPLIGG